MKAPNVLAAAYTPANRPASREAAYLIDAILRHHAAIHWARLQEGAVTFSDTPGLLLTGDAAHPMVPTLGQGATQACEDACVVVDEIRGALDAGAPLARRAERALFVVDFSREATDTMLAGADPVAGTRHKTEPAFRQKLERLYRDVPRPRFA
jgi:salicylate hydroxylase